MSVFGEVVTKFFFVYCLGKYFDVWEWESGKQIDFRPSSVCEDWAYFKYDSNGNLIEIF